MFDKPIPCIVELFGFSKIAGLVSKEAIGLGAFIRVDVPAVGDSQPFTKLYGEKAIYAITPVDEATMLRAVQIYSVKPIEVYRLAETTARSLPAGDRYSDDDNEDDDYLNDEE